VKVGVTVAEDATVIVLAAVAVDTGEAVGDGRSGESSSLPQLEIARQRNRPATLGAIDRMIRLYLSNRPWRQSAALDHTPDDDSARGASCAPIAAGLISNAECGFVLANPRKRKASPSPNDARAGPD
jgi:hypothetical protein